MFFAVIEFLGLIALGGYLYYLLSGIIIGYLDSQVALYPDAFTPAAIAFTRAVLHGFLLIMIIGGIFGLLVWVQRRRTPEGWYG